MFSGEWGSYLKLEKRNSGRHSHFDWIHGRRLQTAGSLEKTEETNGVIICSTELRGLSTAGHGEKERFNQKHGQTELPFGLYS